MSLLRVRADAFTDFASNTNIIIYNTTATHLLFRKFWQFDVFYFLPNSDVVGASVMSFLQGGTTCGGEVKGGEIDFDAGLGGLCPMVTWGPWRCRTWQLGTVVEDITCFIMRRNEERKRRMLGSSILLEDQ